MGRTRMGRTRMGRTGMGRTRAGRLAARWGVGCCSLAQRLAGAPTCELEGEGSDADAVDAAGAVNAADAVDLVTADTGTIVVGTAGASSGLSPLRHACHWRC